jgi:hypothetical protein
MKSVLIIWLVALVAGVGAFTYMYIGTNPVHALSDKCYSECTDPNRPSFDQWGNEFDYMGNLIHAACPNVPDPISGQDNPKCICRPEAFIQGYDKTTGSVACGLDTGCPYGDAVPLGMECDKLAPAAAATISNQPIRI